MILDHTDRRILSLLQDDATLSVSDIAEKVGLSATPEDQRAIGTPFVG